MLLVLLFTIATSRIIFAFFSDYYDFSVTQIVSSFHEFHYNSNGRIWRLIISLKLKEMGLLGKNLGEKKKITKNSVDQGKEYI